MCRDFVLFVICGRLSWFKRHEREKIAIFMQIEIKCEKRVKKCLLNLFLICNWLKSGGQIT